MRTFLFFIGLCLAFIAAAEEPGARALSLAEATTAFEKNPSAETAKALALEFNEAGRAEEGLAYFAALSYSVSSPAGKGETGERAQAACALGLGYLHYGASRLEEALKAWEDAAKNFEAAGDKKSAATSLKNIGIVHRNLGDYARALGFYERSLKIMEEIEDKKGAAALLNNIGVVHQNLGDYARALSFHERGLKILEEIEDKKGAAYSLNNIGLVHGNLGDYTNVLSFHQRSLRINEEIGNRPGAAVSLGNIGLLHGQLGEYANAHSFYERSLKILEEIGDKRGAALTLANLCDVKFGPAEERIPFGERALALALEIDAPERIHWAHVALGRTYAAEASSGGRKKRLRSEPAELAKTHFRAAMESVESLRALLSGSEQTSGFLGTKMDTYEGLVEALLAPDGAAQSSPVTVHGQSVNREPRTVNQNSEVFGVSERMKARSFLDEMASAKFLRGGVPPDLLEQKRLLEARMRWLKDRVTAQ